jgi:hypothetical protein
MPKTPVEHRRAEMVDSAGVVEPAIEMRGGVIVARLTVQVW